MAEMFSAKWVMWVSVLVNVLFTLLTPPAAYLSYIAVLAVRFIEGLGAVCNLFKKLIRIASLQPIKVLAYYRAYRYRPFKSFYLNGLHQKSAISLVPLHMLVFETFV